MISKLGLEVGRLQRSYSQRGLGLTRTLQETPEGNGILLYLKVTTEGPVSEAYFTLGAFLRDLEAIWGITEVLTSGDPLDEIEITIR